MTLVCGLLLFTVEFWHQKYVCESFVLTLDPFDLLVGCTSLPVRPEAASWQDIPALPVVAGKQVPPTDLD